MKMIARTTAATALAATVVLAGTPAEAAQPKFWKPCNSASQVNCVYDADHRGDGEGMSYMRWMKNAKNPSKVTLKFISHEQADRLLADYRHQQGWLGSTD